MKILGDQMILVIGEILFDQFPDYRKLGGAPFNFAYHLQQLGYPVRFISRIGADKLAWNKEGKTGSKLE